MPVPKGYTLDTPQAQPKLPAGYTLDQPQQALPAGATGPLPGVPKAPQVNMQPLPPPSFGDKASAALSTAGDTVTGFGKGLANRFLQVASAGPAIQQFEEKHLPPAVSGSLYRQPGQTQQNAASIDNLQAKTAPTNTAQKVGFGLERGAEFLAPMGAEEKVASLAPKAFKPLAKIGASALSTGLVNKSQGGSFAGGAAAGGVGGAIGEGLKAAAPVIAETALGVRATDRGYGKGGGAIGRAALDETRGYTPAKVTQQAQQKVTGYTNDLETAATNTPQPVPMQPTRNIATDALTQAHQRNNQATIRRTGELADQLLFNNKNTSSLIPPQVPATRALQLRRGLDDLKNSWNPNTPNSFADAAIGRARHQLSSDIHATVPGSEELDQKLSTLIPVGQRAGAADLNASLLQRTLGRFGRPTGALAGAIAGGAYGYKNGGLPEAARDAAFGLIAPEVLASPKTLMWGARVADSPLIPPTVRAITGGTLYGSKKTN